MEIVDVSPSTHRLWKKKKPHILKTFKFMLTQIINSCLMCIVNVACSTIQRQLENLGAQRAGLEDMLKEMKRKV